MAVREICVWNWGQILFHELACTIRRDTDAIPVTWAGGYRLSGCSRRHGEPPSTEFGALCVPLFRIREIEFPGEPAVGSDKKCTGQKHGTPDRGFGVACRLRSGDGVRNRQGDISPSSLKNRETIGCLKPFITININITIASIRIMFE